jgi:hypothetical protein
MVSHGKIDIFDVTVLWQHVATFSTHKEVDLRHVISFEEDVLLLEVEIGSQERTHPSYEAVGSII